MLSRSTKKATSTPNALIPEPCGRHVPLYETVLVGLPEKPFKAVCTGIYGLAPTSLLDGRHVTTLAVHSRHRR